MASRENRDHPVAMNDLANDLARLLAREHERANRAEAAAEEMTTRLEQERRAREEAEAHARELSTLILGDAPREPTRYIPARTRLRSVS
jgi:hypothetical protein